MGDPISIWNLLYFTVLGVILMLLMADSRFSVRKTVAAAGAELIILLGAETLVYEALGLQTLVRLYTPLVHLPVFLLFLWMSRDKNWQMLLRLLSAVFFCTLINQCGILCYVLSGKKFWVLIGAYIGISAAMILFLLIYLRPLTMRVFGQIHGCWGLMCLLLAGYYVVNIYLIPGFAGRSELATALKSANSLLMAGVYGLIVHLLGSLYRELEMRHNFSVMTLQLDGLQKRLADLQAAEEAVRVERHDLRHRLQTAQELVRQRRSREAFDFLEDAKKRLDEIRPSVWCRPPVLDAVFSACFSKAQRQDIKVVEEIALPDTLPVSEGELAVVLANALENAINANMELPKEKREICCKVISVPGIMIEITNPCAGTVRFNEHGLPVAGEKSHGLGVRSIMAFCEKYGAVCQFEQRGEYFRLQLIL